MAHAWHPEHRTRDSHLPTNPGSHGFPPGSYTPPAPTVPVAHPIPATRPAIRTFGLVLPGYIEEPLSTIYEIWGSPRLLERIESSSSSLEHCTSSPLVLSQIALAREICCVGPLDLRCVQFLTFFSSPCHEDSAVGVPICCLVLVFFFIRVVARFQVHLFRARQIGRCSCEVFSIVNVEISRILSTRMNSRLASFNEPGRHLKRSTLV